MTEQFVIQSTTDNLPLVEERLFHFCHEYHVGNYYSTVSVAALQAVQNAIVHGNEEQRDKKVTITFGGCRGGMYVEVVDEGKGFDYGRYGDLPAEEAESGEGIFVMRQLSDRMTYSDGGRCVRLEFMVNGVDPALALERVAVLRQHRVLAVA